MTTPDDSAVTPEQPTWTRPKLGIRRTTTWAGRQWTAWNMAGDRWLLECDGTDCRLALLDWAGVQRMVTTWALPPARPRVSAVRVPIEDVPW